MATKIFLISGSTWQVPQDWDNAFNKIECVGGGGGGIGDGSAWSGSGGGAYSKILNFQATPGNTISFHVGEIHGDHDTWFNGANFAASSCGARGGANKSGQGAGSSGGLASNGIGTIKFSGGSGGPGWYPPWGGCGGGAAGPFGPGLDGIAAQNGGGIADNGSGGISGSSGTEFDSTHGCGGGSDHGSDSSNFSNPTNGGLYGGGACGGCDNWAVGNPGPGLIAISYGPNLEIPPVRSAITKIFLSIGSNWQVPDGWNNDSNRVECIGAGGTGTSWAGGGGGAYSKILNFQATPGDNITVHIGNPNADHDTWFNGNSLVGSSAGAKGGVNGSAQIGGSGGLASNGIGTIKFSGGSGAGYQGSRIGGGGGGAAGPFGGGLDAPGGAAGLGGIADNGFNLTNGQSGTEFDSTHGSGGGGGNFGTPGSPGQNGLLYGGGGGGGNDVDSSAIGGAGIIVITFDTKFKNHLTAYDRSKLPGPVSGPIPV